MDFGVSDLKKLVAQLGTLTEDIKSIKLRLDSLDTKVTDLNKITTAKFDDLDTQFVDKKTFDKVIEIGAKEDLDIDKRISKLEKDNALEKRVGKLEKDVAALQKKVK
jgi:prefoldin subunit 5